jgi:hypothetical protein
MQLVRLVKIFHTLTAMGMGGGLAAVAMLTLKLKPGDPGFQEIRHGIDGIMEWVVVPSMAICVFSGFVSMFVHRPYWNALWAWAKALIGLPTTLMTLRLQGVARGMMDPEYVSGSVELAEHQTLETKLVWVLLFVSATHVVLGIWRPRAKAGRPTRKAAEDAAEAV